ncbi:hypothetical protein [Janibacter sp. LM]|uniref:hypothetical protein n=1 Tax=Janibacter sp. LM TaxID=3144845 RepID=UPI0031F6131B
MKIAVASRTAAGTRSLGRRAAGDPGRRDGAASCCSPGGSRIGARTYDEWLATQRV